MRKKVFVPAVAILMVCCAPVFANNKLPTDQDLQQMFDQKDYRACLQQSARVLSLRPDLADAYDMFTVQMRRGECLLNLGDSSSAAYAYTAALAVASTPQNADQAKAMIALLKVSRNQKYTPKTGADPIDMVSPESRKQAMAALFDVRWAAVADQAKAAANSTSFMPIINFIPVGQELHAVEVAGKGNDDITRPVLLAIGENARNIITDQIQSLDGQINAITTHASAIAVQGSTPMTTDGSNWWRADQRIGLSPDDRESLRGVIAKLTDLIALSKNGKQVAQSFGRDGTVWDPIIKSSQKLLRDAQTALSAE